MNIDWFTFIAQIINFLILVGLLRWFLYGPIVHAMQQREDKIAARWKEAEQSQVSADEKAKLYEQKSSELEEQREELLRGAHREALQHREVLAKEAREDVEQKRVEWLQSLSRERTEMLDEIRHQLGELAVDSTRHTLSELAGADLEERVVQTFADRIHRLDTEHREEICTHLKDGDPDIRVRSAFNLSEGSRKRLTDLIVQEFKHEGEVEFEVSPELICGIEIDAAGFSFGWNVNEFVRQIKFDFDDRIRRRH